MPQYECIGSPSCGEQCKDGADGEAGEVSGQVLVRVRKRHIRRNANHDMKVRLSARIHGSERIQARHAVRIYTQRPLRAL